MRKLFIPIFLAVLFCGIFGLVSFAEAEEEEFGPLPWNLGEFEIENPLAADTFGEVLDKLINFIFWVGITVAPIMLIIAGFMLVTALGDPIRVDKAKKMILYTLIGLAIVILAKGLIAVLKSILGVKEPEEEIFLPLYFVGLVKYFTFKKRSNRIISIFVKNS